jgi:LmbE family N-acetylglucosaminyl deacetylase
MKKSIEEPVMTRVATRVIAAVFALAFLTQCQSPAPRGASGRTPVLLAVFAHPDDEASVAPVLAKYANEGVRVHLAVATDGRLGVSPHAGIAAGDELAAARTQEMQCAAAKLGLQAPILFGLHDQLRMGEGLPAHGEQLTALRSRVEQLFVELKPDAVITWPASGWTGHPDHRLVNSIVTEVFTSRHWDRPAELYYAGVPAGRLPASHPTAAASIDPRFLTVEVPVTAQDYDKARQAWLCHQSQYTPEQIEQLHQSLVSGQQGFAHFMPLTAATGKSATLLAEFSRR